MNPNDPTQGDQNQGGGMPAGDQPMTPPAAPTDQPAMPTESPMTPPEQTPAPEATPTSPDTSGASGEEPTGGAPTGAPTV